MGSPRPRNTGVFAPFMRPTADSGRISRGLLRGLAKGETITQYVSTLENPAILEQLKEAS